MGVYLRIHGLMGKIKETVHSKNLIYLKFTHPKAIHNVDGLVSSWEQIWRHLELHHFLSNGSSAANGCRQSPNSWCLHFQQIFIFGWNIPLIAILAQ